MVIYNQMFGIDLRKSKVSEEEVGQSGKASLKLEASELNPKRYLEIYLRVERKCP